MFIPESCTGVSDYLTRWKKGLDSARNRSRPSGDDRQGRKRANAFCDEKPISPKQFDSDNIRNYLRTQNRRKAPPPFYDPIDCARQELLTPKILTKFLLKLWISSEEFEEALALIAKLPKITFERRLALLDALFKGTKHHNINLPLPSRQILENLLLDKLGI